MLSRVRRQIKRRPLADVMASNGGRRMRLKDISLAGKVAIVTGGSQGIGRAISVALAECGAKIVVADLNQDAAQHLAEGFSAKDIASLAVRVDVTDAAQVDGMVRQTLDCFGTIDVLVNNAGGASGADFRIGRVLNITESDWDKTIAVNLKSTFLCSRAAGRVMWEKGAGSIINMASITASIPWAGMPAYSAAKAGIVSLTRSMALELAPRVRVNALAPGLVETPRTLKNRRPEQLDQLLSNVPLGRMGQPEEISDIALYLASDVADWMTGNIVDCNGGQIWMTHDGRPEFRDDSP